MATLHLHTDVSRYNGINDHQHSSQHQLQQQHDYAAVTPTAARPHPEREGGGYGSLFDAFIPPQYAYPSGDNGVLHRPAPVYPHQHQHIYMNPQQQDEITYRGQITDSMMLNNLNLNNMNSSSTNTDPDYGSLSSCSESVSSSSASGPGTPPPSITSSANASPAPSFSSVPGNTIYNSQGYAAAGAPASLPSYGGYGHAQGPIIDHQHLLQQQTHYQHQQHQQACSMEYMNAYNNYNAAQFNPFPNQFYQDQYALYNAGGNNNNNDAFSMPVHVIQQQQQQYPTMLPGGDMNIKQASTQVSPSMAYNTVSSDNAHATMTPSVLAGMPVSAPVAATIPGAFTLMQGSHGLSQRRASSGHASQGSISSILSSVSAHGSPAPSHSGSDDSGNTTKSAFSSHYSASLSRSSSNAGSTHSHSRRGSVSSAAGTPYGKIMIRKDGRDGEDGTRKFTCSYPGCNRSFSRNFNLSTHYNTHLGVKPFPCSHCPKSFSRRHDCARHVAAVHSDKTSSKNHNNASAGIDNNKQDGEVSPNTCGCGHTCPSHVLAGDNTILFARSAAALPGAAAGMKEYCPQGQGQSIQPRTSVFSFIKGSAEDDDHVSSSSGGYESAASSSVGSYISSNSNNNEYHFGTVIEGRISPSLALSLPASLDFNLVKLEENGEGE